MEPLARIGAWITANEALLSGIAAPIVVAGVFLSPLGSGMRPLFGRSASAPAEEAPQTPAAASKSEARYASGAPTDWASIAVLPFTYRSDDSEQEFLADGMTEDIITGRSATQHLHVVARNSTFAYEARSPHVREVGRALGGRYVLEDSVRRIADKLRITAQLIEAETGSHLWAEK